MEASTLTAIPPKICTQNHPVWEQNKCIICGEKICRKCMKVRLCPAHLTELNPKNRISLMNIESRFDNFKYVYYGSVFAVVVFFLITNSMGWIPFTPEAQISPEMYTISVILGAYILIGALVFLVILNMIGSKLMQKKYYLFQADKISDESDDNNAFSEEN